MLNNYSFVHLLLFADGGQDRHGIEQADSGQLEEEGLDGLNNPTRGRNLR